MTKLLPIGCEYERQHYLSVSEPFYVRVFRYRVLGYWAIQGGLFELSEPVSRRVRAVIKRWHEEPDAYGNAVLRCAYDGDEPSPTYDEKLAECGVEVTNPTPDDKIDANRKAVRAERESLKQG